MNGPIQDLPDRFLVQVLGERINRRPATGMHGLFRDRFRKHFVFGVDHPDRAFLALAASYRHVNLDTDIHPHIGILVSSRMLDRARILGAAMRVAYIISAAMPDILARVPMRCGKTELTLTLPPDLAALGSEKLQSRLRQLARLIGREPKIAVAG